MDDKLSDWIEAGFTVADEPPPRDNCPTCLQRIVDATYTHGGREALLYVCYGCNTVYPTHYITAPPTMPIRKGDEPLMADLLMMYYEDNPGDAIPHKGRTFEEVAEIIGVTTPYAARVARVFRATSGIEYNNAICKIREYFEAHPEDLPPFEGKSYIEIGDLLGVSRARVNQVAQHMRGVGS